MGHDAASAGSPGSQPRGPLEGKTVTVHIGMGKTGTSAIQDACWNNTDVLARHGILYPRAGATGTAHHVLAGSLWKRKTHWVGMDESPKTPAQILEDIRSEADKKKHQSILLSSELFFFLPREGALQEFRELLAGAHVKIIVYIRRMDQYLVSNARQLIKAMHGRFSFDEYNAGKRVPALDNLVGAAVQYVEEWMSVFSDATFLFRPYERGQLVEGDVIRDFLDVIGIDSPRRLKISGANQNPRMTNDALAYKRFVNILLSHAPKETYLFVEPLVSYSQEADRDTAAIFSSREGLLICPSRRLEVAEKAAGLYERIARDYLGRPDGQLFHEPLPDPNEPWKPYPGLPAEKAEEITRFVERWDPKLLHILRAAASRTESRHRWHEQACRTLMPHLVKATDG